MKKIISSGLQILKSMAKKTLYNLFTHGRAEITLIWVLIIIALMCMTAKDLSANEITFNPQVPTEYNWNIDRVDLDRLAFCVAWHETKDCTLGTGKYNNCHGIMYKGKPVHFKSKEESYARFKEIWLKGYGGGVPTYADIVKYSGNDRAEAYYYNLMFCLDDFKNE